MAVAILVAVAVAPAAGQQPRDADGVYADSGFRLPLPDRDRLDAEDKAVYDKLTGANADPRRGSAGPGVGLRGPTGIMLYSPRYANVANDLNWYLRFQAGVSAKVRELAILVVAREIDSEFEWAAHEPIARREGVDDRVIDVVRNHGRLQGLAVGDALLIRLGREAISKHHVSRATYDEALAAFGPKMLVDVMGLMGNYVSTAMMLTTFGMKMPSNLRASFPLPVARGR